MLESELLSTTGAILLIDDLFGDAERPEMGVAACMDMSLREPWMGVACSIELSRPIMGVPNEASKEGLPMDVAAGDTPPIGVAASDEPPPIDVAAGDEPPPMEEAARLEFLAGVKVLSDI